MVVSSLSGYESNSLSVSLASLARFLAAISSSFCYVRVVLKIMHMRTKIIGHNCGFPKNLSDIKNPVQNADMSDQIGHC